MTIVEFLLARFDEDERGARNDLRLVHWPYVYRNANRTIADVESKRRIVENAERARLAMGSAPIEELLAAQDGPASAYWRGQDFVLRLLAQPYVDHADFRDEWLVS